MSGQPPAWIAGQRGEHSGDRDANCPRPTRESLEQFKHDIQPVLEQARKGSNDQIARAAANSGFSSGGLLRKHLKGCVETACHQLEDCVVKLARQEVEDANVKDNDQDKWVPSPPSRRFRHLNTLVLPQTSVIADPATTIAVPRPSFTPISAGEPSFTSRHASTPTVTTFVSRDTITEVTWLNIPSAPPVTAPMSGSIPPHGGPLPAIPASPRPVSPSTAHTTASSHHSCPNPTAAESSRGPPPQPCWHRRRRQSEPATMAHSPPMAHRRRTSVSSPGRHMTSFPPLGRRHFTDDWVAPPVDLAQETPPTLAGAAHPLPVEGTPCAEESPVRTRIFSTAPSVDRRRSSAQRRPSRLPCGVGSSLGISSHRRRRSQPGGQGTSTPSSVLERIRRSSIQLGQAVGSVIAGSGSRDSGSLGSGADRMRAILDRFPQAYGPDAAGILAWGAGAARRCWSPEAGHTCRDDPVPWRDEQAGCLGACSEDSASRTFVVANDGASSSSGTVIAIRG